MARKNSRQLWKDKIDGKSTGAARLPVPGTARFVGTILGIDPSLRGTGLSVVEFRAPNTPTIIHSRTLKAKASISMVECLGIINTGVSDLLDRYEIDVVALEQTIYVQNFQTALILGAARGSAIAAAAVRNLPVFEYPPLRVKQAVVGRGRASKEQVAKTVRSLAKLADPLAFDESDASAVAICHAFTYKG